MWWLRRLLAELSPHRFPLVAIDTDVPVKPPRGLDSIPGQRVWDFAGQNVTTIGFSLVLRIFSVVIILPMLLAGLHINTTLIRRTSGQSLGSISEGNAVRHFGEQMAESYFHIFSLLRTVFIHVSQILFIEASSKTELNQDTGVYLGVSNFVILLICLL